MTVHGLEGLTPTTLLLLIPLVVIQFGLLIFAVVDLLRDDRRVRGGNKGVWAVIIVFVNLLGPIIYFLVGREEGPVEPTPPGPGAMPGWGSPHDPPIVASAAPPGGRPTRDAGRRSSTRVRQRCRPPLTRTPLPDDARRPSRSTA